MLPNKLQQVKRQIERKKDFHRSEEEKELLNELEALERFLENPELSFTLQKSISKRMQITSGPGGKCPCCGN